MKISSIHTNNLRNDTHFQFHSDFRGLVARIGAEKLKVKPQFEAYLAFYANEDEAFKKINKSALTQQIQDADKARDDAYGGMVEINNAYLKHHNPEVKAAAGRLKIVFDTYGNIIRKPLKDQTSATVNILQELQGKYADDCVKVKIDEWVNQTALTNESLNKLMTERFDESAAKSSIIMKDARRELDESYKKICDIINVFVMLEGTANYEQFVKTLNVIITKYGGKKTTGQAGQTGQANPAPTGNGVTGSIGNDVGAGFARPQTDSSIKQWNAAEDYTKMKIGDRRQTADGRIWKAVDLGQVHRDPCGEFGHFGWKLV